MTRESLNKLHELINSVQEAKEYASELLRTARDRHDARTHTFERAGQKITIAEKTMWHEVFQLGTKCDAADILRQYHPEVFDAYEKQDLIAADVRKHCLAEFGIDYTQMSISDYLRLTEELFELMMDERENGRQVPIRVAPDPAQATEPPSVDLKNEQEHRV